MFKSDSKVIDIVTTDFILLNKLAGWGCHVEDYMPGPHARLTGRDLMVMIVIASDKQAGVKIVVTVRPDRRKDKDAT